LFVFLLAQKKNQKKGTLPPATAGLRKGSAGQHTTTITTEGLIYYNNSLSLIRQLLQQLVRAWLFDHVLCGDTEGAELRTFGLRPIRGKGMEYPQLGTGAVFNSKCFFFSFEFETL
jgi:hypothetical protein